MSFQLSVNPFKVKHVRNIYFGVKITFRLLSMFLSVYFHLPSAGFYGLGFFTVFHKYAMLPNAAHIK